MPWFALENYQFCYRVQGDPLRPKLLFLHGFMGRGDDFGAAIEAVASDFCCLTVDLPGHGQTDVCDVSLGYGIDVIADGLLSLLSRLDYCPCYLVGYSMGGRLALYLACHFPQYFLGVLLESASPGLATALERIERQRKDEILARQLETDHWPTVVKQWYSQPLFAPLRQHPQFETLLTARFDNRPLELAKLLRGLSTGTQPSLWENLASLSLPMTLVVGELDSKFISINQAMQKLCPQVQLTIIPNSGHVVHFESPAAFAECVRTLLPTRDQPLTDQQIP